MKHFNCRIRVKTLHFLVCDQLLPFVAGVVVITILSKFWTLHIANKPAPLSPIIPFSINLLPEHSLWTQLNKPSASETNTVWVITPTYSRAAQFAEITRLAQALTPVSTFVKWIILDEFEKATKTNLERLVELVKSYNISVKIETTSKFEGTKRKRWNRGKGVMARRAAVNYLRHHNEHGILYFADDDNTYDSEIFSQMLDIKTVGMWPIGAMYRWAVSSPVVKAGRVVEFYDGFTADRKFPVDFAGLAVNLDLIAQHPDVNIKFFAGYQETDFLTDLKIKTKHVEPLASNCTKVMAWHTRTLRYENKGTNPRQQPLIDSALRRNLALDPSIENTNIVLLYEYYFYSLLL